MTLEDYEKLAVHLQGRVFELEAEVAQLREAIVIFIEKSLDRNDQAFLDILEKLHQ